MSKSTTQPLSSQKEKLNILYLPSDDGAVSLYRVKTLAKYLERFELANTRVIYNQEIEWHDMLWADVIVYGRKAQGIELENHLPAIKKFREECKESDPSYRMLIAYDIDDDLYSIPKTNPVYKFYAPGSEALAATEQWLGEVDVAMVSTSTLALKLNKKAKRVMVRRNLIDPEMYEWTKVVGEGSDVPQDQQHRGRIRLVYTGSNTHTEDLKSIIPALRQVIMGNSLVELIVFGVSETGKGEDIRALFAGIPRVKFEPYVLTRNYFLRLKMLRPDIGLCPLVDNEFNRSKSAIKFYEYTLAGAVVVASPVGQYPEVIDHGENGYLAKSPETYAKYLKKLIADIKLRKQLQGDAELTVKIDHAANRVNIEEYYDKIHELWHNLG